MAKQKRRETATTLRVDPKIRCLKVYPIEGTKKTLVDLKTVGVKMSREQAIHFARVLLAVTQDWDEVEITANRLDRRSDGLHYVTVTSQRQVD